MRVLGKILGLALIVLGIYFIGQNVIFSTRYAYGRWRDISAAFSVVSLCAGVLTLVYGKSASKSTGWVLIALGIISVFFSGGVFLRPTSLWQFLVALMSMASGFQLLTTGRISL